ncbi:hypothetical protein TNIN_220911 [Trichonephila inaurata madagascariensis]|uniref:Uncharacterized protein n=1 Tax=Trichonephila inaurata madagascariensis TaxID=2747483 RepID=A0A8X6XFP9_9ARAC|nr:hypothetical protein TNIN_220911 [Trichonephila inaurata madagascariensis]
MMNTSIIFGLNFPGELILYLLKASQQCKRFLIMCLLSTDFMKLNPLGNNFMHSFRIDIHLNPINGYASVCKNVFIQPSNDLTICDSSGESSEVTSGCSSSQSKS